MKKIINNYKYYIIRVLEKIKILKYLNLVVSKKKYGRIFKIPIYSKIGISNLIENEPWLYFLLNNLKREGYDTIIDVGVNIGQTLIKVKSIGNEINYIGFEPNVHCLNYTNKLIEINQIPHSAIYPIGLSDKKGIEILYADNETASGATVLKDFRIKNNANYKFYLPTFPLQDILQEISTNTIIKIDVEGYELEVIRGMIKLMKFKPVIICEVLPVYSLSTPNGEYRWNRQLELQSILQENDYKIYLIDEIGYSVISLDEFYVHGSMQQTNYLFIHKSIKIELSNFKN